MKKRIRINWVTDPAGGVVDEQVVESQGKIPGEFALGHPAQEPEVGDTVDNRAGATS